MYRILTEQKKYLAKELETDRSIMDIPLFDNSDQVPQPKDKIKIESLKAAPYPDRFRMFIEVNVTPFQERPNLIIVLKDKRGEIISELNVIETMHANMEFTMHIRNVDDPAGEYELTAQLFYENKNPPQDVKQISVIIPDVE